MVDTTRLTLPLIAAAQAQKHVTHNEAIMRLDGLVQMTAKSYTTSAQPGSPADGDLYLLPAGKAGADWGGYSNHAVGHYYDGVWHQYAPRTGWVCFVVDTALLLYYTGSAWANVGAVVTALWPDGTAGAPGASFASDTDNGFYRIGANSWGRSVGGTLRETYSTTADTKTLPQLAPDGSAGAPALTFSADSDTGIYRHGTNILGFATAGAQALQIDASGYIKQTLHPSFFATGSMANSTGDGTLAIFSGLSASRNVGSALNTTSGVFTAPVSGLYTFSVIAAFADLHLHAYGDVEVQLVTTANSFQIFKGSGALYDTLFGDGAFVVSAACLAPMTAGDTATLKFYAANSSKTVDFSGSFAGHLLTA